MADFTRIGNTLNQLRDPVLRRRMFQPSRNDLRDVSRAPVGIQASSPELMNAVMRNQSVQPQIQPVGFMGFDQAPGVEATYGLGRPPVGFMGFDQAPGVEATYGLGMPDESVTPTPPAAAKTEAAPAAAKTEAASEAAKTPTPPAAPDKKTEPKAAKKTKADDALDTFTSRLAELRGTQQPKSKKDRLKEAKEFLKEAGVSDVDDIRTSKDFMLMTLGLNIAAGQSGDFLTNVASGAKETLGTYGELKAKEKEAERAVNLAAAEMAKAEADAARERGAQYDKAELEMLTEQYKQSLGPDKLQIANALVEDSKDENGVPTLSLVDALAMTGKSTQTKFGEYLGALKDAYPNANVGFLANVAGSSAFLKGFIDQYGMEGLTQALGQAVTTQDLNVLQNAQGSAAENKGDQSGGSGITIEPITN